MRVALAQINCVVGDLRGNARRVIEAMARAARLRADLLAVPELALTGYPPEDLVLRRDFVDANLAALAAVARASRRFARLATAVGFVDQEGARLFSAAAWVHRGRIAGRYHKQLLPNYGVFDEQRYFTRGNRSPLFIVAGRRVGLTICEDLWHPAEAPMRTLRGAGLDVIVNMNASPYEVGKARRREEVFGRNAAEAGATLAYVNLLGGQDELVFDGQSFVCDARGRVVARGAAFAEDLLVFDAPARGAGGADSLDEADARGEDRAGPAPVSPAPRPVRLPRLPRPRRRPLVESAEVYGALVLGVRDYARKNGFRGAVVGLSGGIDSALTAVIAADALGVAAVTGVTMSSRFTSRASVEDARALVGRLGIRLLDLPVEPQFRAFLATLGRHAEGPEADLARQNLQSRIRGALLMALSNRYGWLLLATGNKSEMSVGYATLYGDMAGGFAVLKDVPKVQVYRLARWRNTRGRPIPERTFSKAPTAELKAGQRDRDSLPPYPVLDRVLKAYVEEARSFREIVRAGARPAIVRDVLRMVERNEYKRRQAPPGVKVQPKAFGKDRRVPITHGYRAWER